MKKVLKLLVLLFIFVPTFALAASYKVDDEISVEFNNDWYVFTRLNYKGNKELASLGIKEDKMKEIFDNNNLFLDAVYKKDKGFNKEFFIRRIEVPSSENMMDYDAEDFKSFGDGFVRALPTNEYEEYNNAKNKFLKVYFTDSLNGKTVYMEEYVTVYKGYAYSFGLQSSGSMVTESEKEFVKNLVDNIEYLNYPEGVTPKVIEPTEKEDDGKEQHQVDGELPLDEKEEDKEKGDKEKEDKEKDNSIYLYGVIALGIICFTIIVVSLIKMSGKKNVQN